MQKIDENNESTVEEEFQPQLADLIETENSDSLASYSLKQKLPVVATGIISFLLFTIILFPYDELVKNILYKTKLPGITLDFTSLEFPFFGKKIVHSLAVQTAGGTNLKSEEFIMDVSMFSYAVSRNVMGEFKLNALKIENEKIGIQMKTLFANAEISGTDTIARLKGTLLLQISGGVIFKLPEIPMLGQLEKVDFNNSVLNFNIQNGNFVFQKNSNLNTSIAKIFLEGNIVLNNNPVQSAINLKLCPKFKPEFETERPDIVNMVQLLPKNAAGISCIPLTGTFQNPQFNLQILQ